MPSLKVADCKITPHTYKAGCMSLAALFERHIDV
jgi:hypothetical protein